MLFTKYEVKRGSNILKYLIIYIFAINLYAVLIMYIDKQRAIKKKWRIPEARLIFIAVILGSLGIMSGMGLFHHKTKHPKFTVGVPLIIICQLLILFKLNLFKL